MNELGERPGCWGLATRGGQLYLSQALKAALAPSPFPAYPGEGHSQSPLRVHLEGILSLADHIRKQEECKQELEQRLNDLGREFAVLIRDFGLDVIPVMDTTGTPPDYEKSRNLKYRSDMRPTGTVAFPLFVKSHITSIHFFNPMCITTDGGVLLAEKVVHRQSLGGWSGPSAGQVDIKDYVLIYSGAMAGQGSWKGEREKAQINILVMLANAAHRNGIQEILEPVELAMLDVYNSCKRLKYWSPSN